MRILFRLWALPWMRLSRLGWLALLLPTVATALEREWLDLRFTPVDGESEEKRSNQVSDILRGPHGFMWYATREGAHRYDGYETRTYADVKGDPTSLVNSSALTLHIDAHDQLWIGTERGVSRYLPETDSFENFLLDRADLNSNLSNHVNALVHDRTGTLFASSESGYVYRFDPAAREFIPVNTAPLGMIKSMVVDPAGRLWIGTSGEIIRFDPATGVKRVYATPRRPRDAPEHAFIEDLAYLSEEEIWLGTGHLGTLILNGRTGEFRLLSRLTPGANYVHEVTPGPAGRVWAAHNGGITVFDRAGEVVHQYAEGFRPGEVPTHSIRCLYFDPEGNVWAGSSFRGVLVSINNKRFHPFPAYESAHRIRRGPAISALLFDRQRRLWVGRGDAGIDLFGDDGTLLKQFRHDPRNPRSIGPHDVYCLFEDRDGVIWVGSYRGGLQRFDPATNDFTTYLHDPEDPASIPGSDIRWIDQDAEGRLWLLTHGRGVSFFDPAAGTFQNFRRDSARPDETIIDDWPHTLLCGRDGRVYVGTGVGLSVIDAATGQVRNFQTVPGDPHSLSNSVINTIFEDRTGRIWLGTNDGVNRFDPETGRAQVFSVEDGLPNRVVVSIIQDESEDLWIGTYHGLCRFDPNTGQTRPYDAADGLVANEFSPRAVAQAPDGRLFFGQREGITVFRPEEIMPNTRPPEVHLTDLKIYNRSVRPDPERKDDIFLPKSMLKADRMVLSYHHKVISFEFVALNYIQSHKNQYAYMLEGFDDGWNRVGDRREATYTNLNPGTYTFRVRASNNDGFWNDTGRSIELVIPPPYWRTLWFRGVLVALVILIPAALYYWRARLARRQTAQLEKRVETRTRDLRQAHARLGEAYNELSEKQAQIQRQNLELINHRENLEEMVRQRTRELEQAKVRAEHSDLLKSAFLANVSHEIRTPMNAIMGFLEILQEENLTPPERESYMRIVTQSGDTLLALIDDILDLSKIESGAVKIQPEETDVGLLCEEAVATAQGLLNHEKAEVVKVVYEPDPSVSRAPKAMRLWVDSVRLNQILTNLLSNAIKFTDEGQVALGARLLRPAAHAEPKWIELTVRDSGLGIPAADLDRIFDRFHKVDREHRIFPGTGLGLTITKRLVERMGGEISVDSSVGKGTRFTVRLPYRKPPPRAVSRIPRRPSGRTVDGRAHPALQGRAILVAEDEEPNFEFIRQTLAVTGVDLVRARDGEETLESYHQQHFDCILLDLKMPRRSGLEVLSTIRAQDRDTPVIVQTAFAMDEDRVACLQAGASRFLTKPYSRRELLRVVSTVLEAGEGVRSEK